MDFAPLERQRARILEQHIDFLFVAGKDLRSSERYAGTKTESLNTAKLHASAHFVALFGTRATTYECICTDKYAQLKNPDQNYLWSIVTYQIADSLLTLSTVDELVVIAQGLKTFVQELDEEDELKEPCSTSLARYVSAYLQHLQKNPR